MMSPLRDWLSSRPTTSDSACRSSPRLATTVDMPWWIASLPTDFAMAAKNGSTMSGTAMPMTGDRPVRKVVATALGT